MEDRLHQDVAALFKHTRDVGAVDRLHQLIRLFDEVYAYALVILRPVPLAAALAAQPFHDLGKVGKIETSALRELLPADVHREEPLGKLAERDGHLAVVRRDLRLCFRAVQRNKTRAHRTALIRRYPEDAQRHALVDGDVVRQKIACYVKLQRAHTRASDVFVSHIRSPKI